MFDSQGLQGVPTGTTVGQAIAEQRKFERLQLESRRGERKKQVERIEPSIEVSRTPPPPGKKPVAETATYNDHSHAAKSMVDAFEKSQAERRAAAKCEADRPELDGAVSVRLLARRQLPPGGDDGLIFMRQQFEFAIENNSAKTVVGVAGDIGFIDVFGRTVGRIKMEFTEAMHPKAELRWEFNRLEYTHKTNEDPLWALRDGKFKVQLVPETIVFEGGQTLRRHC